MEEDVEPKDEDGVGGREGFRVGWVCVWFGCGGCLIDVWVGT